MSKDGPLVDGSPLLEKPLSWLTRCMVRDPFAPLSIAVLLGILAALLASTKLGVRTSRLDLLNPQSRYNQRWLAYLDEFGGEDDTVVAVFGRQPERVVAALDEIAERLHARRDLFTAVLDSLDHNGLAAKGLYWLDERQLRHVATFAERASELLRGDPRHMSLSALISQNVHVPPDENTVDTLGKIADSIRQGLLPQGTYVSPWPAIRVTDPHQPLPPQYLTASGGRIGFILLHLVDEGRRFDRGSAAIDYLRGQLRQLQLKHPQVEIGLTGLPVMENDEMRASTADSLRASAAGLLGVALLFAIGFGGLRHALLAVAALVFGIVWTFAYVVLSVGHLNILSMSFGVILIGLGIDFGIHYIARYLSARRAGSDYEQAIVTAAKITGPGIITGGVTTALAFYMAGLTRFTGIAELGVIGGGGILLCMAATIVLLPALLAWSDRGGSSAAPRPLAAGAWSIVLASWPRTMLLASLVISGLLSMGIGRLSYDHNLMNLQPAGLESVAIEERLLRESDESLWFALSIADDPREILRRAEQFRRLPSVERVEEIVSLLPPPSAAKAALVTQMGDRIGHLPYRSLRLPPPDSRQVADALGSAISHLETLPEADETHRRLRAARELLLRTPPPEAAARLSQLQRQYVEQLQVDLRWLAGVAAAGPPTWHDLPQSLVNRFVGKSGKHLLRVYGRENTWEMSSLKRFVNDVRSVDPAATGKPLQTYEASREMQQSYLHAATYALLAILIVLIADFWSVSLALVAVLPVVLGLVQMFGIMGLAGIDLNPANMIVLPLIMGIGIDDGVHILHDFRLQRGKYRLSSATATAVVMTSLTTMIGFGSLLLASHRGLQSLGRICVIGVSCCMFSSLITLPAVLRLFAHRSSPGPADHQPRDIDETEVREAA